MGRALLKHLASYKDVFSLPRIAPIESLTPSKDDL